MTAKKSAPKRKRSVPAPSGPKTTVAAKKKHVRELAKARRWVEIERLYGKKIVAKAKTYAENRVVKTAQEIARDILAKNGLLLSGSHAATSAAPAEIVNREVESSMRGNLTQVDAVIASGSPELTKEQQELIEKRRREALERRRRALHSGMGHHRPPVVIQPDSAEDTRRSVQPSVIPLHRTLNPPLQTSRTVPTVQTRAKTQRVVTPENLPTTNMVVVTEQVRPEYFWDDLEAAAEIVKWENEHMAEVTLVQPPAKVPRDSSTAQLGLGQQNDQSKLKVHPPAVSTISQELAAAAEIIQWENEHEVSQEVPALDGPDDSSESEPELGAPQFQLLPVHVTDDFEQQEQNAIEPKCPQINNAKSRLKSNAQCKRPLAASPPPALPHSSVVSSKAAHPSERNQRYTTSSYPSENQRDPTAEFIDKHLLEDKLELPVLEFLDMMLA